MTGVDVATRTPLERPLTEAAGRRRARRGLTLDNALRIFASIGKFLRREFAAAFPVFLFFVVGFLLLLLLIKLALANFSIEMTALSKAVIGALFAAKAVLILDETPLAHRWFESTPLRQRVFSFRDSLLHHPRKMRRSCIEEALHRDGRGPFSDFSRRRPQLAQVQLHPPADGPLRTGEDPLLDDLRC